MWNTASKFVAYVEHCIQLCSVRGTLHPNLWHTWNSVSRFVAYVEQCIQICSIRVTMYPNLQYTWKAIFKFVQYVFSNRFLQKRKYLSSVNAYLLQIQIYNSAANSIADMALQTVLTFWRRIFFFKFQHTLYLKCE